MPRWIDHQAGKGDRMRAAREAMREREMRHARDLVEIKAFRAEQEARPVDKAKPRGLRPGERRPPPLSDEELRQALGRADRQLPRMLDYPHLLIFRERGWTRQVWADVGKGDFGAPQYRGDVLTEAGESWLRTSE